MPVIRGDSLLNKHRMRTWEDHKHKWQGEAGVLKQRAPETEEVV